MRLIVISGFLGTGKTTLIINLVKSSLKMNKKVAILVNEIGDIGIDNQLMRQLDLNVKEILGGCICCSLAGNLASALENIIFDYDPELVFLEPSGAANLKSIDTMFSTTDCSRNINLIKVTVVDPLRLDMMMSVITPLITSQIQYSELIVINKQDAATKEEMASATRVVRELNPEARIVEFSAKSGSSDKLLEMIL